MGEFASLKGKRGLVVGIANEQSIAYACAKDFRALGADLAVTYLMRDPKNTSGRRAADLAARKRGAPG